MINLITSITKKPLLAIGYFLLAVTLSLAGLSVAQYYTNKDLEIKLVNANREIALHDVRLAHAESLAESQANTIADLRNFIDASDVAIKGLTRQVKALNAADGEFVKSIEKLSRNDKNVSNFMDMLLPDALASLLNNEPVVDAKGD